MKPDVVNEPNRSLIIHQPVKLKVSAQISVEGIETVKMQSGYDRKLNQIIFPYSINKTYT